MNAFDMNAFDMKAFDMKAKVTLGLLTLVLAVGGPAAAQEKPDDKEFVFWEIRQRQEVGAAAQVVLARHPLTVALLRDEGLRWKVWLEPEFLADTAPALNPEWLEAVRDGTPMPNVRGKAKDEIPGDQEAVINIWNQAVIFANTVPPDAFAKSAEENNHVTFAHLWTDPARYRGKVIPVRGWLVRLRKYEPLLDAKKAGVSHVYEGWVKGPTRGSNPFVLVFTHLPDGLKEAEEMSRPIHFNAYFIKKMKYRSGKEGDHDRETPVFIGPTVILEKESQTAVSETPYPLAVVVGLAVVVLGVTISIFLLSWYFRKGDQAMKVRLEQMQEKRALEMLENVDRDLNDDPAAAGNKFPSADDPPRQAPSSNGDK